MAAVLKGCKEVPANPSQGEPVMSNAEMPESSGPFRYWAFISYSHADEKYASWLHTEIETYRGHAKMVGSMNRAGEAIPKRLSPVFRDRDELAAATDLPSVLHEALLASKFLIVICSRAGAKSTWVNQEILRFKAMGRSDRILAVVVDGEPWASRSGSPANECFPHALRYQVESSGEETECAEPLAADARATGDGKHNALVKIIAAMLGVRFDELRQRDAERRRRNRMITASVLSVITLSLLGMLAYSVLQRRRAAAQAKVADSQKIVSRATRAAREFRVDQAMLLAVAAYNVAPTFESRQLMWQLLGTEPTLKRYLASSGPSVTSIAFDADGRYAATSNQAGSVTVWDLARGIAIGAPLQGNDEEIAYVCFAGGHSEQVAAVTVKNNLITWQQGKRSGITPLSETELAAVHCATDAPELLGVDATGRILAWDLSGPNPVGNERGHLPVASVLFTRSGRQVAAVDDHTITVFDLKTGSSRSAAFTDSRLHINTSEISDDGSLVATVDSTSTLQVWKADTGKPTTPIPLQLPGLVISLQFSPNSKSLALALNDGSVQMVVNNWMQFGARMRASGTDDKVLPVEFSPNGEVLLSGFMSGKVVEWHPTSSSGPRATDEYSPCPSANAAHVSMGGGLWLGSYCDDGTLVALSLSTSPNRRVVTIGKDPEKEVKSFQLSADGKRGLVLYGNRVGLVDFPNASIAWKTPDDPADSFAGLTRDWQAAQAAAFTTAGEMILWDMQSGSTHSIRSGVKDENWSPAALDASRGHLVAASRRHVFLGTVSGDRLAMRQLFGEVEDAGGFTFLNHGLDLVGLGLDGKVLKWHLSQGDAPPADAAPGVRARLTGYSPVEDLLLAVLDDSVHLVDPTSGRVLLESPATGVREFSFSPDGTKLALTSGRYIATVLDLDVNRWVHELCAVANRNMSEAEWESNLGADVLYHRGCPDLPGGSAP